MPLLKTPQVSLNYQTYGQSTQPTLIFSNSLGTNLHMWSPQLQALQAHYHIIAYDTRGHGGSSAPKGPYTLAQLGEDVIALLDHLEVDKAYFCGISMGGLTGQWLAIHYPERFYKVMVCNTAAKIGEEAPWRERAALVRQQGLTPIAETAAGRWFTESFIKASPEIVTELSDALASGSPEGYASCCEALAVADLRDEIANIDIPVVIVAGQKDPVTTVADGKAMAAKITDATLLEIDASHISNIEEPQVFTQYVRSQFQ